MASESLAAAPLEPALEGEYNLRIRHPEREGVYREFAARSADWYARAGGLRDQRYASGPRCLIDVFPALCGEAPSPLLVFIHGGYWRALNKEIFAFLAEAYNRAGIAVALVGYDLAPAVTLTQIVEQLEQAMRWLARSAAALGVRSDGVVLSGHSAGGQLCGVLAGRTPEQLGGLQVGGVAGISGVFDLRPLLHTSVNRDVRMSDDEVQRLSPIGFAHFEPSRFVLAAGALETDGFQQQSQRFAQRLRELGHQVELMLVQGRTHFDVLDDLGSADAALFRAVRALLPAVSNGPSR
ncbi:MAG: alpha/beta hydrolase [Burkholderiales bacterium]|nr:alpha/beta hydrolase [Burkholderiales bacterium]